MSQNSLTPIKQFAREELALKLLRTLASDDCNGRTNVHMIARHFQRFAFGGGIELLKETIRFLEGEGALRSEEHEEYLVVTLTERGADVAAGLVRIDGVAWRLPD